MFGSWSILLKWLLKNHVVMCCHGLGGELPASQSGGPGSISGQSMWDLWWTKWHWGRFSVVHTIRWEAGRVPEHLDDCQLLRKGFSLPRFNLCCGGSASSLVRDTDSAGVARECRQCLTLDRGRFLPNPFQLIFDQSPRMRHCVVWATISFCQ
jgi:hypothetical protein